jgi:hypothetical protein
LGDNEKDGYYCSICGGIPPDKITTKRILVDGKETGIDQLDWIIADVVKHALLNNTAMTEELLLRVKKFNYVPTKKPTFMQWHFLPNTKNGTEIKIGHFPV